MGSLFLFMRQQAFKMGYFCWLRVKNSNYLHAEFSPGYLGDTKFYLKNEATFIDISSISWELFSKNKIIIVFHYQTFFPL